MAAPIPDDDELPEMTPRLGDYRFPADLWPPGALDAALSPARLARLRAAVSAPGGGPVVAYSPSWDQATSLPDVAPDLVISQAVLEHVDDLPGTYRALARWLRPGGAMSHAIDFRCHNMVRVWNGHWAVPDPLWRLVRGRRRYLLNREPCSRHLALLERHGFGEIRVDRYTLPSALSHHDLAARFRGLSADDLTTGMATVQSRRLPE
jgi:SAM-dependent methyltransferase